MRIFLDRLRRYKGVVFFLATAVVLLVPRSVMAAEMEFKGDSIVWTTSGTSASSSTRYQSIGWNFTVTSKVKNKKTSGSVTYYTGAARVSGYVKSKAIESNKRVEGEVTYVDYSLDTSKLAADTGVDLKKGSVEIVADAVIEIYNGSTSYGVYKTKAEANAAVHKYGFSSDFDGSYSGYYNQKVSMNYFYVSAEGGTGIKSVSPTGVWEKKGETVKVKAVLKTGYLMKGWQYENYSDGEADEGFLADDTVVTLSKLRFNWHLEATAEPIYYYVSFQKNSADSGEMDSQKFVYDKSDTLSKNTYKRTGYRFSGWNTKADGSGTGYSNQQSVKNLSTVQKAEIKLYAQWEPVTYSVSFDGNGATGGKMSDEKLTYGTKKALTANKYTRTGYTFSGWNTKKSGSGTSYTDKKEVKNLADTQDAVVTLYAQWKPVTYSVSFDGNGSTGGKMSDEKLTYDTKKALTANKYTRTGYTFSEWNTKKSGKGTSYADEKEVKNLADTQDAVVTLYAQWEPVTYSVSFDGNGSTGGKMSDEKLAYDTKKALTANKYTRTGYTFSDWNTKKSGKGVSYTNKQEVVNLASKQDAAVTLYAQWNPISYTVKYDGNGSTGGKMPDEELTYDTDKMLTANQYTRTGYTFSGWNTNADGSGTVYNDGQSVCNLSAVEGAVITLYAQWEENVLSIYYHGAGADSTPDSAYYIASDHYAYHSLDNTRVVVKAGYSSGTVKLAGVSELFLRNGYMPVEEWGLTEDAKEEEVRYPQGESVMAEELRSLIEKESASLTLYARWREDLPPGIEAYDRYVTLDDARSGRITEEFLFARAAASDPEDGVLLPGARENNYFVLTDYSASRFKGLTGSAVVTVTFQAADSAGHVVNRSICVYVVDTTAQFDPAGKNSLRFISLDYLDADEASGGLRADSVWRDKERGLRLRQVLESCMGLY